MKDPGNEYGNPIVAIFNRLIYYMASSVSGQYAANSVFDWLPERAKWSDTARIYPIRI